MKCAICNKEINGGFVVEKECLEKLKSDLEFSVLEIENNKHGIYKLEAENAELKARLEKAEKAFYCILNIYDNSDFAQDPIDYYYEKSIKDNYSADRTEAEWVLEPTGLFTSVNLFVDYDTRKIWCGFANDTVKKKIDELIKADMVEVEDEE